MPVPSVRFGDGDVIAAVAFSTLLLLLLLLHAAWPNQHLREHSRLRMYSALRAGPEVQVGASCTSCLDGWQTTTTKEMPFGSTQPCNTIAGSHWLSGVVCCRVCMPPHSDAGMCLMASPWLMLLDFLAFTALSCRAMAEASAAVG